MKSIVIWTLTALCLSATSLSAVAKDKKKPAATKPAGHPATEVSLTELKTIVEKKSATIIDANSATSYETGHIPGAVHFGANEKDLGKVLPADKAAPIVAYCGGPLCTAWEDAAKSAIKLGYTNVKHFKGGLKTWKDSGLPLEPAKKS